jgi:hypothetical protein
MAKSTYPQVIVCSRIVFDTTELYISGVLSWSTPHALEERDVQQKGIDSFLAHHYSNLRMRNRRK